MKENNIIVITTIFNFVVAILKLISGILFSFSTLIADSIQSFMDFITDIISIIVNKIGKRRSNKTYPFGYGQIYYIANLFTGFLLFLIGIFILYQFFFFKGEFNPKPKLVIILLIILVLKLVVVILLHNYGRKLKSELMIEAFKESKADFISTCIVLIVLIISFMKNYIPNYLNIDKIGSLGMAIYIFYISIKMFWSNIKGVLINDVENDDIKGNVIDELKKIKELEIKKVKIIKMATYYNVFLQVTVKSNITIKEYLILERKAKYHLKSINKAIRFIDMELVEK